MKFLCDNCKAKYQIGDEKVAGKTVRMKCRKCGYAIQVTASSALPSGDDVGGETMTEAPAGMPGAGLTPGPRPAVAAPVAPAPPAAQSRPNFNRPDDPPTDDESTSIMTFPVALPPKPAGAPAAAPAVARTPISAVSPRPAIAPRPPGPGPAPRAPVAPIGVPRAAPSAAPAPRPAAIAARPAAPAAAARPVGATPHAASPQRAGVAGAFARAVTEQPAPATTAASGRVPIAEDWYVGIGGVPLGPVKVAVIRDKALAGVVDGESLVWREGLDEWRPLKTFPELLEVVAGALAARRSSTAIPAATPDAPRVEASRGASTPLAHEARSATPAAAAAHAAVPVAREPVAPAAPAAPAPAPFAPAPAAPTVTSTPAPAAIAPAAIAPAAIEAAPIATPVPSAPIAAAPISVTAEVPAPSSALAALDAAAAPLPKSDAPVRPAIEADLDDLVRVRRPTGPHPMAYAFIAAAAVFGGVAAYVLLVKPQPQIVVVQQAASTPAVAEARSAKPSEQAQIEVGEPVPGATGAPRLGGPLGGPRPKVSASASAAAAPAAPLDTSGFNNTVPGPTNTPPGSQPIGGGQLSQGEISGVVSQNQPLVKRKCWQPALEARAANAPTNARVNGSITIGPSGAVESANASGAEKDFPGLSSCIAARMKGWKFPASGSSTTVNVPFVFAGQ